MSHPHRPPHYPHPDQFPQHPKSNRQLTRRDFLALIGMGTAAGAAAGLGLGYLLLDNDDANGASLPTPTINPTQIAHLRSVEQPPIISRQEWGALDVNYDAENEHGFYSEDNLEGWREYEGDLRDIYNTIIIHHSSLYEDDDEATMLAIQLLHMGQRGWADIAYHFCVGQNGKIYEGRRMTARGTHTEGHNTGTLGLCLLGNFEEIEPTLEQLASTQHMVNWLAVRLSATHLAGHRDFNDITVCPGKNLYPWLDGMAQQALLQRGIDGYVPPPEQLTPTADPNSTAYRRGACPCGCCDIT
jgi:hypothetical protein